MTIQIKNWSKHQHFKDRTPPWIKLYRDILDDPDWHELNGDDAKTLVSLWLIASEDETHTGTLPDTRKLAFRLRISESQLKQRLTKLSHWLRQGDITPISDRYQSDAPETEREREKRREETETETEEKVETLPARFDEFWAEFPVKKSKPQAMKAYAKAKINGEFDAVMDALRIQVKACKDLQFFPHASTWINNRRWEDEMTTASSGFSGPHFAN